MKVTNVWPQVRGIPDLDIAVDPGVTFEAPAWWVLGDAGMKRAAALEQVWFWEAADDEGRAYAAAHPELWDHPYVAELTAAGQAVAARPKPVKTDSKVSA